MLGVALLLSLAAADVSFHSMFTGGAILQRNVHVSVYGTGPANSALTVQLSDGKPVTATVRADGTWLTTLPPHPATPVGTILTLAVKRRSDSGDILSADTVAVSFGETIVCSGQSNMGMPVQYGPPCCETSPGNATCHCFHADNGTAEVAAAGHWTGKIQLASVQGAGPGRGFNGTYCPYPWTNRSCVSYPMWNAVTPDTDAAFSTIKQFSALCWYTGTSLFEQLRGEVPVGLILGAVGGSPIEFWLPEGHVNNSVCGVDTPACDSGGAHGYKDSDFFDQLIRPFTPYTVGTVVWDQAERDVHCLPGGPDAPENRTARYSCQEAELVRSWRTGFKSDFGFVAVQLPGYLGDCGDYEQCMANVFEMRLQQQAALVGLGNTSLATVAATYDIGCPPGVDFSTRTARCPWGSVHNVNKRPIGERVATQIAGSFRRAAAGTQWPGPALSSVRATPGSSSSAVTVAYAEASLFQADTANCVACCTAGAVGDFDASFDGGRSWVNGTRPVLAQPGPTAHATAALHFDVPGAGTVTHVRYTANQPFPQCAIYSPATVGPALPFRVKLTNGVASIM